MNKKINKTAYAFLICFKYILKKRIFTIDDIVKYLWDEISLSVCPETILKYIRTLKQNGVIFKKTNSSLYELKEFPLKPEFTSAENDILFTAALQDFYVAQNPDKFKSLINKLSIFYPTEQSNFDDNWSSYNLINKLEQYCTDTQRLQLRYYKNNKINNIIVEPRELVIINKIIYLKCYNVSNKENTLISLTDIETVKQTPVKNKTNFTEQYAILKFSGKCINNYNLKSGEELMAKTESELLIKSFYYDKEFFFKNILRYMDNCEIIKPLSLRREFQNYLHEICQIYN